MLRQKIWLFLYLLHPSLLWVNGELALLVNLICKECCSTESVLSKIDGTATPEFTLTTFVYVGKGYWLEIESEQRVSNFKPVAVTCMLIIYMHPLT